MLGGVRMGLKSIDEAIKHAYAVYDDSNTCIECRLEHQQLGNWLQELKELKIKVEDLERDNKRFERYNKRLKKQNDELKYENNQSHAQNREYTKLLEKVLDYSEEGLMIDECFAKEIEGTMNPKCPCNSCQNDCKNYDLLACYRFIEKAKKVIK